MMQTYTILATIFKNDGLEQTYKSLGEIKAKNLKEALEKSLTFSTNDYRLNLGYGRAVITPNHKVHFAKTGA